MARFFDEAFYATRIERRYLGVDPATISDEGPLLFVANHPFGIVDGLALCDIALQARGDFRIMIHSLLCQDKDLAPYFLPVDFNLTKAAMKNNIRAKKVAQDCLKRNIPILIFPSGFVSTASKKGFGGVVDAPWTTFAAKLIRDAQASVVPVYFPGRNRRAFHLASHIAEPLRMALLLSEARHRFRKPLNAVEQYTWLGDFEPVRQSSIAHRLPLRSGSIPRRYPVLYQCGRSPHPAARRQKN